MRKSVEINRLGFMLRRSFPELCIKLCYFELSRIASVFEARPPPPPKKWETGPQILMNVLSELDVSIIFAFDDATSSILC